MLLHEHIMPNETNSNGQNLYDHYNVFIMAY